MLNSEQTILYRTQLHTFHQDLHLTPPHYPYIYFTSHPALIHFTYHFPTPVLGNIRVSPYFKTPSFHLTLSFTSLNTFLCFTSFHLTLSFTSLHLSLSNPCSWKYSSFSVLQNPFISLNTFFHFTSLHLTLSFTSLHFT